jgi:hypothetical protein
MLQHMNRSSLFLMARSPVMMSVTTVALFAVAACGGGNDNLPPPPQPSAPPPEVSAIASAPAPVATVEAPKPAPPPVTLTLGTASPDPTPLPTVQFAAPKRDIVVPLTKAADFEVKLDVKNWLTATGSAHVHLILDNKPYKPIYDTKAAIKLSELTGGEALAEGQHVLVAFPSRANHESVKTKGAFASVEFYVGKKVPDTTDLKKPMLVYSRPKGEYKGDNANHVLVDFYVANVTLAEGKEHVSVSVTGPGMDKALSGNAIAFGAPFYLDNLQNGAYTMKLELLDKDNKVLPGPWNSTTRTITINRDAAADNPHGAHAAASASAAPTATPSASAKPKP